MKYVPEKHLFQYDQGVYIIVPDEYRNCTAQFYSKLFPDGLAMENEIVNGKIMCQIPNQMLVNAETIIVYAFRTGTNIMITESLSKFSVTARPKPPDFVLDPTDTVTYKTASDLITDMQTAKSEEAKRVTAETLRATAETERSSSETVRKSSEAERVKAESLRTSAEQARITAETERANAESDRASAEQLRAAEETERARFYEGFNSELNKLKDDLSSQDARIKTLEEGGGVALNETDPTVPDWAKQPNKPTYTASEVGARPDTWMPSASDVGADPSGTATSAVSQHNTANDSHNDIRQLIAGLTTRLNALADSDDTTLDQMSEIVAYIKSNRSLIESVTTNKVNVADIIDNLTTNVSNKPLSASQGVALKALIDAITVPIKVSQLENDRGYLTEHQDLSSYRKSTDQDSIDNAIKSEVSKIENDLNTLSLGVHTDGLIYVFVNGEPKGTGVEQGTSGDVVGYVDSENNIVLTGELAEGKYSLKYEMEDGSTVDIGELNLSSAPAYTNQIPISTDASGNVLGYKTGYRLSISSGNESALADYEVTGFIPCSYGDVIRIKDIYIPEGTADDANHHYIGIYNSSKTKLLVTTLINVFKDNGTDEGNGVYSYNNQLDGMCAFIRICSSDINDNSIVTINEEIV